MKSFSLLTFIILISGCSSITARVGDDSQLGKPYSGMEHAVDNLEECNILALLTFIPAPLVLLPISTVDVIGSLVVDTVLLPIDLIANNEKRGKQSLCHINISH